MITVSATALLSHPAERVFDLVTAPDAVARTFEGYGPIPAALASEVVGGGPMRAGAIRRVRNADGSVVDEEILTLERPRVQAYRLIRGLRPPLRWLVRQPEGRWLFSAEGGGTRVQWTFTFDLRTPLAWPLVALIKVPFEAAMRRALAKTGRLLDEETAADVRAGPR